MAVAIATASIVVAGCGGASHSPGVSSHPVTATKPSFVCHHKDPAQLGECVRQELEYDGITPARPPLTETLGAGRPQCVDISRWQPHPRFRQLRAEGIVCVIVQGADNTSASNPFFDEQVRDAHEAGMAVGAYIYVEGGSSTAQADALGRAVAGERSRITLGVWIDTEQPDAYQHACGIAARLRSPVWRFTIIGDYGSVGTVPASMNTCALLDWAAMWGGGPARPAPGFTFAELKFRQWCGTCILGGNDGQIDRDEDLGLLALGKPKPKPSVQVLHTALEAALRRLALERTFLERHHCRQPPWHTAVNRAGKPDGHWEHACHVERRHGHSTNQHIKALVKAGAR